MFEGMCTKILEAGVTAAQTHSDTISTTAIALSFIMSLIRIVYMAYEKGMDQWTVYARKQAGLFAVVVVLCFPLLTSGPFITSFPATIIKMGLSGIDSDTNVTALSSTSYGSSIANTVKTAAGGETTDIQDTIKNLIQTVATNVKTTTQAMDAKGPAYNPIEKMSNVLKVLCIALLVFLPVAFMTLPVFVLNIWVALGVLVLELAVCVNLAAVMVMPELVGTLDGTDLASAIYNFVKGCMRELGIVMFYTALTFGFFGTMVSVALKSAVFCATFPISIVNLAFEKQVSVFIQNVVKIFSLAITPIILVTTFQILITAFGVIAKPNGPFDTVMNAYVIGNFNQNAASAGTVAGAIELYALLFRLLISCFLSPTIMCVPAVAIMLQAHKIAGELLGAAVGYSTMLSQTFSRAGGNIGTRGMGM